MKRQRNRWIAFALSVVMLLSVMPPVYGANYTAALLPAVSQVAPGETVTVALELSGAVTCGAYLCNLKYPADFQFQKQTTGDITFALSGATTQNGYTTAQLVASGAFNNTNTLGNLTFHVLETVELGEYEISIVNGSSAEPMIQFDTDYAVNEVLPAVIRVTETAAEPETPSVPAGSYSAQVIAPSSATVGDEDVTFTIEIDGDSFSAAQMTFTYDPQRLALTDVTPGSWDHVDDGTVTVADFGDEKTTPASYVLTFDALKDGSATVTLQSALLGNADSAASEDAAAAVITAATASVNIAKRSYSVTLPDIFAGETSVTEGDDYTFAPADDSNYSYSNVQATVGGGAPQTLTADAQGKYTVEDVTGDVVITGERTPKTHTVTFQSNTGVDLPEAETVTYGVDYSFTIPSEANYDVTLVSIQKKGADVPYTISGRIVTVAGVDLTDDIVVTLERERNNATVQIPAALAGLLSGGKTAVPGEDYTAVLTPDERYTYTVTATVNGEKVTLIQSGNNYTIAGSEVAAGDEIVFAVEQAVRTDQLTVSRYLQLDGAAFYLVKNNVARETENVYVYEGTEMLWSAEYNAYCCLVKAETQQIAAGGTLELKAGSDREITYGTDTNLSGITDINDAQFVYNLYKVKYQSFTDTVTMEKVLSADVDGSGTVNMSDAQIIVDAILNVR